MGRVWLVGMVLVWSAVAAAQQDVSATTLDVLAETPIPAEVPQLDPIDFEALSRFAGKPVVDVLLERPLPGFDPVADARVQTGAQFSTDLARAVVARLWETGRYRDIAVAVRPRGDGVALVLRVSPLYRVAQFRLSGNQAVDDAEIKRALAYVPGMLVDATDAYVRALRDRLVRYYSQRGYTGAQAVVRLETTDHPGELALVVAVEENAPERYVDLDVVGLADAVNEERLLRASGLQEGVVRDEEAVAAALEKLQAELVALGYPDARVSSDVRETRLGPRRWKLRIAVETGLATDYAFVGNARLRTRALREVVEKAGVGTDAQALVRLRDKVRDAAVSAGLYAAQVAVARVCRDARGATLVAGLRPCPRRAVAQTIVFRITEGRPVQVGALFFDGARAVPPSRLRDEVFAFLAERYRYPDVLEPLGSDLVDRAVGGDDRSRGALPYARTRSYLPDPSRVFHPKRYERVVRHLQELYAEQGYLDARITYTCDVVHQGERRYLGVVYRPPPEGAQDGPCLLFDAGGAQAAVVFTIDEGPQTVIQSIEVQGHDPDVMTRRRILQTAGLAVGQPYNEFFVREGVQRVLDAYRERGYVFASVDWDTRISADRRGAQVYITVSQGPQVRVGEILVHAEQTRRSFLRDNAPLREGDLLTPSALSRTRSQLMEIGIFDSVSVQMQSPQTVAPVKNVEISVTERKSQYLELRAGVATEEGVRGGFEYGHRNVGGIALGYRLRFRVNYRDPNAFFLGPEAQEFRADLEERYRVYNSQNPQNPLPPQFRFFEWYLFTGLRTARLPGTGGLLGAGADITFQNLNRRGYSALTVKPRLRLTSNYVAWLPVELSAGFDGSVVIPSLDHETHDIAYSRLPAGRAVFFVGSASVSLDKRDNALNPKKGVIASVQADYVDSVDRAIAVVGAEDRGSQYIRGLVGVSGYVPISAADTLALSGMVGYIFHLRPDSVAWADRHFYMGGVSTLRGFPVDSLVPEDIYERDWDAEAGRYRPESVDEETGVYLGSPGGQAALLLRMEWRHDFGSNVGGALFAEAGNLWRDEGLFLRRVSGQFAPYLLRPTAGAGVLYHTPVGPLAFYVGANLLPRKDESKAAWYFSIGSAL